MLHKPAVVSIALVLFACVGTFFAQDLGKSRRCSSMHHKSATDPVAAFDPTIEISCAGEVIQTLRDRMQKGAGKLQYALRVSAEAVRGSFNNANQLRSRLQSRIRNIERRTFNAWLPIWLCCAFSTTCIFRGCLRDNGSGRRHMLRDLYIIAVMGAGLLYAIDPYLSTR